MRGKDNKDKYLFGHLVYALLDLGHCPFMATRLLIEPAQELYCESPSSFSLPFYFSPDVFSAHWFNLFRHNPCYCLY